MQFLWLEKLANEGKIRPHICDEIYKDCSEVLGKFAQEDPSSKVVPMLAAAFAGPMGKIILDKYTQIRTDKSLVRGIEDSREQVLSKWSGNNPDFQGDPQKALARFKEIEEIAPRVAAQPALATQIIKTTLNSGFTGRDIQSLAKIQASMDADHTAPARVMEKLEKFRAKQSPMSQAKTAADVMDILKMSGARMSWEDRSEKTAATKFDVGTDLLKTVGVLAGAQALLSAGAGAASYAKEKLHQAKLKKKLDASFEAALRQSDPNREPLLANKDKARLAFETMAHFAPQAAVDPSAARAFMSRMVSMDVGVNTGAIKELSEINRNLTQGGFNRPTFSSGFTAGFKELGGGRALGNVISGALEPAEAQIQEDLGGVLGMDPLRPSWRRTP